MNNETYSYAIGEDVILGCTALDDVDGAVECTYTGTINNQVVGDYEIVYTAIDSSNNRSTLTVIYTIYEVNDYLSMDLMAYYDDAEGLDGETLQNALHVILDQTYSFVNYDNARYILDETDADPNIAGNVILIYTQYSVSGVWDSGITWNREHIWPQSYLVDSTSMDDDLHNLKPANQSENSSRGNRYFDDVAVGGVSYLPPDEVKGDIARILFYMVTMYDELTLVEDGNLINTSSYNMGLFDVLLAWHYLDPVDDFERNRNEVIYSYQDNRNPFIDYEHFVELIWGDHEYFIND